MPGNQEEPAEICRALYPATERFWQENGIQPEFGFKILNGPPIKNAPYLFIGYQPGGGAPEWEIEKKNNTHKEWPKECEYLKATWRLATILRRIFPGEVLKDCLGTNAIFLRYKKEKDYRLGVGKKRDAIEKFCRESVGKIVDAIQPMQIVTIGFKTLETLEMFGESKIELSSEKRPLIKSRNVFGRNALGLIHLTGARPSNPEIDAISEFFKNR